MKCPMCGGVSIVTDTRHTDKNETYRKRICKKCSYDFLTVENDIFPSDRVMEEWHKCERKKKWEMKGLFEDKDE